MTSDQIATVENLVFDLADGTALIFPIAAPAIGIVETLVKSLLGLGIIPYQASDEQLNSIGAAMAASQASAVTSVQAHNKGKSNV